MMGRWCGVVRDWGFRGRLGVLILFASLLLSGASFAQDQPSIGAIQRALYLAGHDPGPADGQLGSQTRAALRDFQRAAGLPQTGEPDAATLTRLFGKVEQKPDQPPAAETRAPPGGEATWQEGTPTTDPANDEPRQARSSTAVDIAAGHLERNATWLLVALVVLVPLALMRRARRKGSKGKLADAPQEPARTARLKSAGRSRAKTVAGSLKPAPAPPQPRRSLSAQHKAEGDRLWIGPGQAISIAGHGIPGGMIYVGEELPDQWGGELENCLIDPSLPVASARADTSGQNMDYWPAYHAMAPSSRLAYLRWLSNGRTDSDTYIGYVFLFFYGLERRLVLEQSAVDASKLIDEVRRLRATYGENRSFARYSSALLDAAAVIFGQSDLTLEPEFVRHGYQVPLRVTVAIGRCIQRGDPVSADWMLSWVMTHPETKLGTASRRNFDTFRELFKRRFAKLYPDGFSIDPIDSGPLTFTYKAASSSFEVPLDEFLSGVPDISRARNALAAAQTLAVGCADDLAAYGRFLTRRPDDANSLEALAFLPQEVRGNRLSDLSADTLKWLHKCHEHGDDLQLRDLFLRLRGDVPDKITQREVKQLADALGRFALGLSPDPRFALRKPKGEDEVVIFRLPGAVDELGEATNQYRAVLLTITLGMLVAQADGVVSESEETALKAVIAETEGLTEGDRARLRANLTWMKSEALTLGRLRSQLRDASAAERERIAFLAVSVAGADGRIDPVEVRLLEKLYRTLALETSGLYDDLNNLGAELEEPAGGSEASGSGQEAEAPGFRLDPTKISTITEKTAEVSQILGSVFEYEEEPEPEPDEESLDGEFEGLDRRHGMLLAELLKAESWTRGDFEKLARQFDLMPDGALETLNDWSLEAFDETLVDEGEPLAVNREILEMGVPEHG